MGNPMFCPHCGRNVGLATRFCRFCGGVLKPSVATVGAPVSVAGESISGEDPRVKGVWGWLLFFCVILTVLAPLATFTDQSSGSWFVDLFRWLNAAFALVVGINLWSKGPYALRLLRVYFLVAFTFDVLLLISAIVVPFTGQPEEFGTSFARLALRLVALALLVTWFAYFRVSKRVKLTYGANL
jgi:hypothetical protein